MGTIRSIIRLVTAAAPGASVVVEAALALLAAAKRLKADDGSDVTPEQLSALWAEARAVAVVLEQEARDSQSRIG